MSTECPACGSGNTQRREIKSTVQVPYGPPATYSAVENLCSDCGEEGDFDALSDAGIDDALDVSKLSSIGPMFDLLAAQGISNAYFERALRLPARTVARWKNGEFSAASLALLRVVRTFPWLLQVADEGFTARAAETTLVREASRILGKIIERTTAERVLEITTSGGDVAFKGSFTVQSSIGPQQQELPEAKLDFLGLTT